MVFNSGVFVFLPVQFLELSKEVLVREKYRIIILLALEQGFVGYPVQEAEGDA